MKKHLKVVELFSGIGAPRKALMRGGYNFTIVSAVEIDKYPVASYNAMYNDNIVPQSIADYFPTTEELGEIDLIWNSSPCQDISIAGKGAGATEGSGTRSSLIYEAIRVITALRPKYVVWENVKGLTTKKHRHVLDDYIERLNNIGYYSQFQVLNAKDYGIPQNRERVFTVSIRNDVLASFEFPQGNINDNKIDRLFNFSARNDCRVVYDENGLCPTLVAGMGEGGGKVPMFIDKGFQFPPKQELKLKLKDILEDEVDEKYYLSDERINKIKTSKFTQEKEIIQTKEYCDSLLARDWKDPKCVKVFRKYGIFDDDKSKHQAGSIYDKNGLCPTLDTMQGGWRQPCVEINDITKKGCQEANNACETLQATMGASKELRIRKLTPKECFRLMGFDDEDYEKAAKKKEISYIEGGMRCNAKLKIVNEKQRLLDTETYVLCTTKDMLDMETPLQTKWKKSIENENNGKMQNVNIVIEMLGDVVQEECATNIIKCGETTIIRYTLMEELDQHRMVIIELEKRGNVNTGKYMKIILEENLNPMKLYITSILIEQIIKSKIYTCIAQQANIQGNIAIIEDCKKNLKIMKLSNLKMEYITRLNSDAILYKQAGNSVVVNVIEAIFDNLLIDYQTEQEKEE